jgi:hypothetical protein
MIYLALLRRYAVPIAAVLAITGAYVWHRAEVRAAHKSGYADAEADMAQRVRIANEQTAALEQRHRQQSDAASAAWESSRNELQGQVDGLLRRGVSIRVCKSAVSAPVSAASGTAGSVDGPAAGNEHAVQASDDIGPAAVLYGGDCERIRRQLGEIQEWVRTTRGP